MPNPTEAKRLFHAYTGGTGVMDCLYGPAKAGCRAHILSALLGTQVPQRKAGWNVLRQAMVDLYAADGNCMAAKERQIQQAVLAAA